MNETTRKRIYFVGGGIILVAFIILGSLYHVQIMQGSYYREKADKQYVKPQGAIFDRGSIYFESKEGTRVSAATVKSGYTLAIVPKIITDPEKMYNQISEVWPISESDFLAKAQKPNDSYEEIAKHVTDDAGAALLSKNILGLQVIKDAWRVYPGGSMAAQTIGIVGYKGNDYAGRYGLERYYEDVLSRNQTINTINLFAEIFGGVENTVSTSSISGTAASSSDESIEANKDPNLEGDILSTIDPSVQNFVEAELVKTQAQWKSDELGAIVINPKTGEIYSFASYPTFDPNNTADSKDPKVFSNPLVENVYEMGSIIKPLTMASGIDAGAITPTTTYDDKGYVDLDGRKVSNYDHRGRGVIPMQEVLNQSLNTGVTFVMLQMGRDLFSKYFYSFGFGTPTGIDQPNEAKGIVSNLNSNRDIEHATASFGQGIALTPIQTARALSTLANGGYMITPHLVKEIDYANGSKKIINPPLGEHVLKTETTDAVTRMLITVVDKALVNGQVKMDRYSIAAKTGTAQIADPVKGGYYSDRYLHSFFGYFPAYDPKFLVFLYQVYPKGAEYASATLTNPFIDIANYLINYYQIPPDR